MREKRSGLNERADQMERYRDWISGGLAVIFYIMFIALAWHGIFQKSLAFFMGEDTGIPGNPRIIPENLTEPALWSVVRVLILITLYAFLTANPEKGLGHAGQRLSRQDLRGRPLERRAHFWTAPWWLQAVLIFAFAYYLRIQVVELIGGDTIQVMDFKRVFYMSLEDGPIFADVQGVNFYQAFPNWALHVKLLHLLNVNFGGEPMTGIMYNAVISSVSASLLYLTLYFSTGKDAFAVISALIFSCWPFYLYYTILLTPDFSFVFFCLLGLLVLVAARRFARPLWLRLPLYALAGICLSLAGFFKSIDKVLIIALFIAGTLWVISLGKWNKRRAAGIFLAVLVFLGAWTAAGKLVYRQLEAYVGGPVNSNVAPYFLNVGMNVDTSGQWSQEVLDGYLGLVRETDYDFDEVNREMKERLSRQVDSVKARMREDGADPRVKSRWDFFDKKLQKAWADNEGVRFIMQTINPENELYGEAFYEKFYPEMQAYQVAVAFLMILGAVAALLVRERRAVLICALMVFGFALLLLISEVQPRYKAVVFPFMSAVAAYGIYGAFRLPQLLIVTAIRRCCKKRRKEV